MTPSLLLYTRAGCHLCDEMFAAAHPIAQRHGVAIEKVDVDDDPALRQRYGLAVPVLAFAGREVCRHRLDPAALEGALAQASASAVR